MQKQLSVYVHWPFCASKCPYCDFNSHVRESIDTNRFISAYLREIRQYREALGGSSIKSIFFGGGTPSLAPPSFFDNVINELLKHSSSDSAIEITLEANPTSVEAQNFAAYATVGVNRVSIGIQSFISENLKFLGRQHSVDEAKNAISCAHKFFSRYSFDLIYGLPEQSSTSWEAELRDALQYTNGHISLYQLTIEKGTPFYSDYKKGKFMMPTQELSADLYQLTQCILEENNMPQYEISNHAFIGNESVHNMNYWEYGDYIGIGAGAHGRYSAFGKKYATANFHSPEVWLKRLEEGKTPTQHFEELDTTQQNSERIMMGLRTVKGIDANLIANNSLLAQFVNDGYITKDGDMVKATAKGRLVLNKLITELVG